MNAVPPKRRNGYLCPATREAGFLPGLKAGPPPVYLVAPTETVSELVAVDPVKRTELWRKPLPARGPADAPPVQAGDRIYVANTRGVAVYKVRTGELVHQQSVPAIKDDSGLEISLGTEPMVVGGIVYAPSSRAGWVSLDTQEK